jgi:hypothetical protein
MSQDASHKRPLEDGEEGLEKKKPRLEPQRFKDVVVEIGEEHDWTISHVIEGDMEGRDAFETLVQESKELDDEEQAAYTAFFLGELTKPENERLSCDKGAPPTALSIYQRLSELAAKYHITSKAYAPFEDAIQEWTRSVNYFVIDGFF